MRTFIAVEISKEVRDYLYDLQKELKQKLKGKINWVAKKNLHITLKFLGDTNEEYLEKIKEKLNEIKFNKFSLELNEIDFFPNKEFVKVVFVNFKEDKNLIALQKEVDSNLLRIIDDKQEFSAHVTLGRIKVVKDRKSLLKGKVESKSFEVNDFSLFKSKLSKDGPKYFKLEEYNLN
jgi:RNA 2',3'-cyclic 3'-phosphodiesterase